MRFVFRIEVQGLENLPDSHCLLISNHNSGAVIESHSLVFLLSDRPHPVYGLNHQSLFRIPFVAGHFRKIGAIAASREMALSTLHQRSSLLIFPGGNRQAFRPLSKKHQNDFPWAKGWAEIACQAKAPVVPIKFIGSHDLNPIFFDSEWLSTILVLPRLLKIRHFPVSLAQLLFGAAAALAGGGLAGLTGALLGLYFGFVLTPLIPVLPKKVKIKIYPPLQPDCDFKNADELCGKMNTLMARVDYPHGPRVPYRLNGIERMMLYSESDKIHYNSQLVLNFRGDIHKRFLLDVTQKWLEQIPHLRTTIEDSLLWPQRYSYEKLWFQASDIMTFESGWDDEQMNRFCYQKFDLGFDPGIRFLVQSEQGQHRLIFSCHHSLFDGAAQAFALEAWSKIYNHMPVGLSVQTLHEFHYRETRKKLGILLFLKYFWKNFSFKPPRNVAEVATLQSGPDADHRQVASHTLILARPEGRRTNPIPDIILALHKTLQESGDTERPLLIWLPMGLRWQLKIRNSLQNAVVSTSLFLKRSKFESESWRSEVEAKLSADLIHSNQKFIFGNLFSCSFWPAAYLRKAFAEYEKPSRMASCSLLLVHAPFPNSFSLPFDWQEVRISARGTLLKSPCVGIIFTGQRDLPTLTIEYIPSLVSADTIARLEKNLALQFEIEPSHLQNSLETRTVE